MSCRWQWRFVLLVRLSWAVLLACTLALCLAFPAVASDQALLILKSSSYPDMEGTVAEIEAIGAHAQHVMPPDSIIASVPAEVEAQVRALANVAALYRGPAPEPMAPSGTPAGISAWNHLIAPKPAPVIGEETTGEPLTGDFFTPPHGAVTGSSTLSAIPSSDQTSLFMVGKVAVGVIIPESTGHTEDWDASRQSTVYNEIVEGLNWWVTRGGSSANLTFYYENRYNVPTQYEPITMSGWSDEGTWLTDILQNMGYTSGDQFTRIRAYDNYLRTTYHTDWAYSFIVVDSYHDTDGKFTSGYFAYAYLGGPYVIMTYDNDGWGIGNMSLVSRHETGHIFQAGDEYCSPGYACCDFGNYGYLNVYNGNCESGNPASVPCIMRTNEDAICTYTFGQIGWTDSDSDGKPNVIDNVVTNTPGSITSPTRLVYITLTGTATDVPFQPPTQTGITINKITTVKFRVDGGQWTDAAASDGAFDQDTEAYTLTTSALAAGQHSIETQAFSSSGNASSVVSRSFTVQDPDLTPPVMGAVDDDGDFAYDDSRLTARWSATDPDSGVSGYLYAIGVAPSDPGSGYVKPWQSTATSSVTESNLQLTVGGTYYFYVKAMNASAVPSAVAASNGITVTQVNIAQAKALPGGKWVGLKDKIVTGSFTSPYASIYVEEPDRSSGVRVRWPAAVAPGTKVTARGYIQAGVSTTSYEREITSAVVTTISTGSPVPKPFGMNAGSLGGVALNSYTPGVAESRGANNVGLLVRVAGRITSKFPTYFYIRDGATRRSDKTNIDIRVEGSANGIGKGDFVVVTGVAGICAPSGLATSTPLIRIRDANDVKKL
jgi:hypothetical protein